MKRKRISRIAAMALCAALLLLPGLPASANSALTRWEGASATGIVTADETCPLQIKKERLTFELQEFPEEDMFAPEGLFSRPGEVRAAYTFENPADYAVKARLLFPFGATPSYGYVYDPEYGSDDLHGKSFGVTVDGEPIEKELRFTLFGSGRQFDLERDLALLRDDYVEDDFFTPDLTVTKYVYTVSGVDVQRYPTANAAFLLPPDDGFVVYFPEQSGISRTGDGYVRLGAWVEDETAEFEVYLFGNAAFEPTWTFYENGGMKEEQRIDGTASLEKTEWLTFREFALSGRPEESDVSEIDWYNAVVAELRGERESGDGRVVEPVWYKQDYRGALMRWYEYEIEVEPDGQIVNEVTAPIYPTVDIWYTPPIYSYTYLLSPAQTWKEFGPLEIVIRTPYYLTESKPKGFEETEGGYRLALDGLPDGELTFTLSASSKPEAPRNSLFDFLCGFLRR